MIALGVVAALMGIVGAKAAWASVVLVDPANTDGWTFSNGGKGSTGAGRLDIGPGTPPLGTGSAYLSVNDTASAFLIGNTLFQGTPLSSITGLSYDTYVISASGTNLTPALQFVIATSPANTGIFQGELVFSPTAGIVAGSWQTWNALTYAVSPINGGWWFSSPSRVGGTSCTEANPCTLAQVLAEFPNAEIGTTFGGELFQVGSGWNSFSGAVDDFVFDTTAANTTFNFDPNPVPEPGSLAIFGAALLGLILVRTFQSTRSAPIRCA